MAEKPVVVFGYVDGHTAAKFTAGGNFVQSLWVQMDYFTVRILLFTIGTAVKIGHN